MSGIAIKRTCKCGSIFEFADEDGCKYLKEYGNADAFGRRFTWQAALDDWRAVHDQCYANLAQGAYR